MDQLEVDSVGPPLWQPANAAISLPETQEEEYLANASPEERYKYLQAETQAAEVVLPFLGKALYELSPFSQVGEFVDDVKAGSYAAAAIAVLMVIPALKGVRVTHHIIARLARQHKQLRKVIEEYGINIDDPANLARLVEDVHRVLHTNRYYKYVERLVGEAKTPDQVRAALQTIKGLLERLESREHTRHLFPPKRPPRM